MQQSHIFHIVKMGVVIFLLINLLTIAIETPNPGQAAAEDPKIFLPVIFNPHSFTKQPKPLSLAVRLDLGRLSGGLISAMQSVGNGQIAQDISRGVQAIVTGSGGVITTTAADGAQFTLEIPDGALLKDTQIQMIPLAAISGKPLGGSNGAAVQLQPDGLQFFKPVTLTILPSQTIPVTNELSVSWHSDGQEFHRYPLEYNHPYPAVVFRTMHFSGFGYLGDMISIPVNDNTPIPSDPEDQYKQAAEEIIRRERESQVNGQGGDPNFHQNMINLLRTYYNEFIRPAMTAAETDCEFAKGGAISKGLGWSREAEMIRSGEELNEELGEVQESFRIALSHCWEVATHPCLNKNDTSQMQEVLWIARQGQLVGLNFNPDSVPDCKCTGYWALSGWELTFTSSYNRQAQAQNRTGDGYTDVTVNRTQSGTILLNNKKGYPPFPDWDTGTDNPTGSASISDSATKHESNGKTYNYSTTGSGLIAGYASVSFDELRCTYDLKLIMDTHATDSDPNTTEEKDMYVISLLILDRDAYTDPTNMVLSGEGDFDANSGAYIQEGMYLNNGDASHVLYNLFGSAVGNGHATWSLKAIP